MGGLHDLAAGVVDLLVPDQRVVVDEQEAEHVDGLGQLVHPLGDQRHRQLEQPGVGVVDRVADDAGGLEVGQHPVGEVVERQQPHVVGVDRLGLLEVEAGRVGVDVADLELLDHLVEGEDVAVRRDRPAEQGEVVEQPLGQEAGVAVGQQVGLRVALGELLVALAHHVGQVAELRGLPRRCRGRSSAANSATWRGVEESRSSPRSTWVISISASSTGLTSV